MTGPTPAPFTADDYRARMDRAARAAADAGLAGLLVAPGPDLVWLTGYAILVARARGFVLRPRVRWALDVVTGTVLVAFGTRLALARD